MRAAPPKGQAPSLSGLAPSPLCDLIRMGDVQALKRAIVADDSAINAPQGPWARTLLMVASELGTAPCAMLLLQHGARVATVDMDGSTALHIAAAGGHDQVVHCLLYHNADPFVLDGWGSSPLAHAAAGGHAPIVRRLLQRIQQLTLPRRPALPTNVSPPSLGGSPPGRDDEEEPGPVDAVNKFGRTPLWRAACGGHVEAVGILLQAGADPTLEDDQGCDPRAIAGEKGHDAIVALIDNWMAAALPTVSPYSTSSDGRGGKRPPPAHFIVPSPALT